MDSTQNRPKFRFPKNLIVPVRYNILLQKHIFFVPKVVLQGGDSKNN